MSAPRRRPVLPGCTAILGLAPVVALAPIFDVPGAARTALDEAVASDYHA